MARWNLALRFGLEVAALAGLGFGAWNVASGAVRWIAVFVVPVAAATAWVTFNVRDDPSRSGAAPIEVAGWIRLTLELLILGAGAAGFAVADRSVVALVLAALVVGHYLASRERVGWLLTR